MTRYAVGQVYPVQFDELGDRFCRYRMRTSQAVQAMVQSLKRWGQCVPIVACVRDEKPQVLDGFTRWETAQQVRGVTTLSVQLINVDDWRAKAAIYGRNQVGRGPHELEEAWIVHLLVREDGLSQVEVAELIGRHKSWVCRCLALLEKLGTEVHQELEFGLRIRLPRVQLLGCRSTNSRRCWTCDVREALIGAELAGVVSLFLASATTEQKSFVLTKPREALKQANKGEHIGWDPRLSTHGN